MATFTPKRPILDVARAGAIVGRAAYSTLYRHIQGLVTRGRRLVKFPVLWILTTLFLSLSLVQILRAPEMMAAPTVVQPSWKISYFTSLGWRVRKLVSPPARPDFIEGTFEAPLRIEIDLARCEPHKRYRFWVGPWGIDDTLRQPRVWRILVLNDKGEWVTADSEDIKGGYSNKRWYTFPLHYGGGCFRFARMEVLKLVGDNVPFRLYTVQFLDVNPSLLERLAVLR